MLEILALQSIPFTSRHLQSQRQETALNEFNALNSSDDDGSPPLTQKVKTNAMFALAVMIPFIIL